MDYDSDDTETSTTGKLVFILYSVIYKNLIKINYF